MSDDKLPTATVDMVIVTSWLAPAANEVGALVIVKAALLEVTLIPSKVALPVLAIVNVFVGAVASLSTTPKARDVG